MPKHIKVIITVIVLVAVLSFCVFCLLCINTRGDRTTTEKKERSRPPDDSANELAAVRAVQNYQLPSGNTILHELELIITGLALSNNRVEPQGWYAGKWDSKYNVGFSAKVNGEERKWRFLYYPDTGNVEPANPYAERLW